MMAEALPLEAERRLLGNRSPRNDYERQRAWMTSFWERKRLDAARSPAELY